MHGDRFARLGKTRRSDKGLTLTIPQNDTRESE